MNIYVLLIAFMPLLQRKFFLMCIFWIKTVLLHCQKPRLPMTCLWWGREALPVQGSKKLGQGLRLGLCSYSEVAAAGVCCFPVCFACLSPVSFFCSLHCLMFIFWGWMDFNAETVHYIWASSPLILILIQSQSILSSALLRYNWQVRS